MRQRERDGSIIPRLSDKSIRVVVVSSYRDNEDDRDAHFHTRAYKVALTEEGSK